MAGNKGTNYPDLRNLSHADFGVGADTGPAEPTIGQPSRRAARTTETFILPDPRSDHPGNNSKGGLNPYRRVLPGAPALGMLGVDGGHEFSDIERIHNEQEMHLSTLAAALQKPTQPAETIANFVQKAFRAAANARKQAGVDDEMVSAMYAFAGKYTPKQLETLKEMREPPIYLPLTQVKCRAYSAWVRDIIERTGRELFSLSPTEVPDLPDGIMDEVIQRTMTALQQSVQSGQEQAAAGGAAATIGAPAPSANPAPANPAATAAGLYEELRTVGLDHAQATAKAAAKRMQSHMIDQLEESDFQQFWLRAQVDISHLPYMVMRGPFIAKSKKLRWSATDPLNPEKEPVPEQRETHTLEWERTPPWDFYLSPGAKNVKDADYVIERRPLSPAKLAGLIGLPDVDDKAVSRILAVNPVDVQNAEVGGTTSRTHNSIEDLGNAVAQNNIQYVLTTRQERDMEIPTGMISEMVMGDLSNIKPGGGKAPYDRMYQTRFNSTGDAIDEVHGQKYMVTVFVGQVSNRLLDEYGIALSGRLVPHDHTECEIWACGNEVIRFVANPYPENRRPYHMSVFAEANGHGYGQSLPMLNEAAQSKANSTIRALAMNLPYSARPSMLVEAQRIINYRTPDDVAAPGATIEHTAAPPGISQGRPVNYLMHPSIAPHLENSLQATIQLSDELTGVPSYARGLPATSGAGRTSSGLNMLLNAAARGIKDTIFRQDIYIIKPALELQYLLNMLYSRDRAIKADARVSVMGSRGVLERELKATAALEALQLSTPLVGAGVVQPPEARQLWFQAMRALGVEIEGDPQKAKDLTLSGGLLGQGLGQGLPQALPQQQPGPPATAEQAALTAMNAPGGVASTPAVPGAADPTSGGAPDPMALIAALNSQ